MFFLRFFKVSIAWAVHYCATQVCLCVCVFVVYFLLRHVLTYFVEGPPQERSGYPRHNVIAALWFLGWVPPERAQTQ